MISKSLSPKTVAWLALMLGAAACGDDTSQGTSSSTGEDETSATNPTTSSTTTTASTTVSTTDPTGSSSSSSGPDTDTDPTDDTDTTTSDTDATGSSSESGSDSSSSSGVPGTCNDDGIDGDDVCDGADLGGADCASEGFDGGTLGCLDDCSDFDTTMCTSAMCDGVEIKGTEVCDGANLDGQTCALQGFDDGTLACAANCMAFDTSGCNDCGDNNTAGAEVCDGTDVGAETCVTQGFPGGGTLGCAVGCDAYDTSGCLQFACEDEDIGSALGMAIATGVNFAADDDDSMPFTCNGFPLDIPVDHVMVYTAAAAGTYTFDTAGSTVDTLISTNSDCTTELACHDDVNFPADTSSSITVDLELDEVILIAITGFAPDGAWQLNASLATTMTEDISVTAGPALALAVPDDGYDGTLGSMACVDLDVADNGINEVTSVDLDLGLDNTWVGDLTVKVVSPSGTVTTALSRPGFADTVDNGTGCCGDSSNLLGTDIINFADGGATDAEIMGSTIADAEFICSGDGLCLFAPNAGSAVAGTFADLVGETTVGTWQVCVGDSVGGDPTTLQFVSLNIGKTNGV